MEQKFGINQITSTTPSWAKWFFRIVFLLTKIIVGYIAATNLISPEMKYEITLFLTLVIDPLAFGFSKLFGIGIDGKDIVQLKEEDIGGGGIKNNPPKP